MPFAESESVFGQGYHDWWNSRWTFTQGGDGEQTYGAAAELYREVVDQTVEELGIGTVLDVGCGACNQWADGLPAKLFLGIDVSEKAIEHARSKYPDAEFIVGDITKEETWDALPKVGLITCSEVLNHVEPKHYRPLVARIFHTAQKAVILRMWQRDDLHGAGGYHWSNPVPEVEGWGLEDLYHSPNSSVGATIFVYRRSDA